jgi:hypothetical protein
MATVGEMSRDLDYEAKVWRAGCYIGVYNVPTAELIWRAWPTAGAVTKAAPGVLQGWLSENWGLVATRRERRSVRTPAQLARFLEEYAAWTIEQASWRYSTDWNANYERFWAESQRVYSLGRYVALKLLEFLRRYVEAPVEQPDLRLKDGWSPREGLALLYPGQIDDLARDDVAEHLGQIARDRLLEDGLELTRFEMQVLLCDYKQAYVGQRQYPGRSLDSELEYWSKAGSPGDTEMWNARRRLFPDAALGEVNGWWTVRKELGTLMREAGYVWSDLRYDYLRTIDIYEPDRRAA